MRRSRKPLCVLLAYREFESPPLRFQEVRGRCSNFCRCQAHPSDRFVPRRSPATLVIDVSVRRSIWRSLHERRDLERHRSAHGCRQLDEGEPCSMGCPDGARPVIPRHREIDYGLARKICRQPAMLPPGGLANSLGSWGPHPLPSRLAVVRLSVQLLA
jgi:hypothetical protein